MFVYCRFRNNRIMIKLAPSVIKTTSHLAEILVHEMCHAGVRCIDRVSKGGHGPFFKAWGKRVTNTFKEIPVTRCHKVRVKRNYIYKCSE